MPYVLTRQNWRRIGDGVYRLPGAVDVDTFAAAEEAEQKRDELTATARERVNPFTWGDGLFDVTGLPPFALADWMQDADLTPPPADAPSAEWQAWWDGARSEMTPRQVERAWQAFDKIDWYAVEERGVHRSVWVMMNVPWRGDDEYDYHLSAAVEGGDEFHGFSDQRAATAAADRRQAERSANADPDLHYDRELYDRAGFLSDPVFDHPWTRTISGHQVTPYAYVVPLRVATEFTGRVFVVARSGWRSRTMDREYFGHVRGRTPEPFRTWAGPTSELPLVGFATRAEAERTAWQMDIESRPPLNPFRFGAPPDLSTVGQSGYRGALADLGLDLPPAEWDFGLHCQREWAGWWEQAAVRLTDDQLRLAWELFDQLRFYTVLELDVQG